MSLSDAAEAIALAAAARRRGMLDAADEAFGIGFRSLVAALSGEQLLRLEAALRNERLRRIENEADRASRDR